MSRTPARCPPAQCPEELWALATAEPQPKTLASHPIAIPDFQGSALRRAAGRPDLAFPRTISAAAAAFLRLARAPGGGGDAAAAAFCREHRDALCFSRTIYLGRVV